jgi:exodeoxyribonuclease VII small subunit
VTSGDDSPGYAEAMAELENILEELEGDQLDVDVLAERVRRASELIKLCRTRIARAQGDVDRIVTDLESFERDLDGDAGDAADTEDENELF